ncbi:transposase [Myxococcus sp. XM-1-1-1]|nr:transposase [Myxococcus sp. XM-1-1-1]
METRRQHYSQARPHSGFGYLTPPGRFRSGQWRCCWCTGW